MLFFDQLRKNDRSLRTVAWGLSVGILVLLAGLYYVQVISRERFLEEQKTQSYRSVRLPAARGKIMDRNGILLAENRPSYQISLYLEDQAVREQFKSNYQAFKSSVQKARGSTRLKREELAQLARISRFQAASNLVAHVSTAMKEPIEIREADFTRHYESKLALPMPIIVDLKPPQIARFSESPEIPPGFDLEIRPVRYYANRSTAAHVLGYLVRDEGSTDDEDIFFNYRLPDYAGDTGLEARFNDDLKGRPGAKAVLVNNLGYRQSENEWSPIEPGRNLCLTIDVPLQKEAEYALSGAINNARGAVVVMDVRNGDVYVMASSPGFDPNSFIPSISQERWDILQDKQLHPLWNRAIYGHYPPGSIFKVVVGLAALENGLNPAKIITSPGYASVGNRSMHDTAPAGEYNFKRALKLSCNKYFVDTGIEIGPDRIVSMAQRFLLGTKTGIELGPESSGILPTKEWIEDNRGPWRDGDTANLSIGQGDIVVTPLQIACMISAVANGGTVFQPRLVDHIEAQNAYIKTITKVFPPGRIRSQIGVSQHSLEIMREAMAADVEDPDGTGKQCRIKDFRVCAKTGTAEVKKGTVVVDKITWFASFGPVESPRYAVVVMVESGGSGGSTCAPVARKVYEAIIKREKTGFPAMPTLAMN